LAYTQGRKLENKMKKIEEMCIHELVALQKNVVERIRYLIQMESQEKMQSFYFGDKVCFENNDGRTIFGKIEKFNKKSVSIIDEQGLDWRVSPQLLRKIVDQVIVNNQIMY